MTALTRWIALCGWVVAHADAFAGAGGVVAHFDRARARSAVRLRADDRGPPGRGGGSRGMTRRAQNRRGFEMRRLAGDPGERPRQTRAKRAGARPKRTDATDALYEPISIEPNELFPGLSGAALEAAAEAILAALAPSAPDPARCDAPAPPPPPPPSPPSKTQWGSCSVGPVFLQRLRAAGLAQPSAIQEAAFAPIARGERAILSSPTGSGKTLAFLLPLLARTDRSAPSQILLVCPSVELALQLRGWVDMLWPPQPDATGEPRSSVALVLPPRPADAVAPGEGGSPPADALRDAPLIAGTPHALLDLFAPVEANGRTPAAARALARSLRALVLDEADQLLGSEDVIAERRWRAVQGGGAPLTARQRAELKRRFVPTPCEMLLRELPMPKLQLVCASASAGRALRRQLQPMIGAASVASAFELISTLPSGGARASRLPATIDHRFVVWRPPAPAEADRADLAPIDVLCAEMARLPPAPAILFVPRRLGTRKAADALREHGLENLVLLPRTSADAPTTAAPGAREPRAAEGWARTPIYVASERWGRGLDLELGYVFMLAPPANSASYMHLAGRTGRYGANGTALTLTTHLQAPRLAAFAEQLRVAFEPLRDSY